MVMLWYGGMGLWEGRGKGGGGGSIMGLLGVVLGLFEVLVAESLVPPPILDSLKAKVVGGLPICGRRLRI